MNFVEPLTPILFEKLFELLLTQEIKFGWKVKLATAAAAEQKCERTLARTVLPYTR